MRKIVWLILIILGPSCNSDYEFEKLKGHWHKINESDENRLITLDINDEFISINLNDLFENSVSVPIPEKRADFLIPLPDFNFSGQVSFQSDTLIISFPKSIDVNSKIVKTYWIKTKVTTEDIINDFNRNLLVNVEFIENDNSLLLDTLKLNNKCFISIGKPNKNLINIIGPKDTFLIQLNDGIGNLEDIKDFLNNELDFEVHKMRTEIEYTPTLILNFDINTPENLIDSINSILKQQDKLEMIYKTCFNKKNKGIGLINYGS